MNNNIVVGGRTARIAGKPVAYLKFGNRVIEVSRPDSSIAGRLLRSQDGDGPAAERYQAWSAESPVASTPSDRLLGEDLLLADGVAAVLGG